MTQTSQAIAFLQLPKADPDLLWPPCVVGALQEKVLLGDIPGGSRLKSSGSCSALISITNQINTQWPRQKGWRNGELIFIPMKYIKLSSLLEEHLKSGDRSQGKSYEHFYCLCLCACPSRSTAKASHTAGDVYSTSLTRGKTMPQGKECECVNLLQEVGEELQ